MRKLTGLFLSAAFALTLSSIAGPGFADTNKWQLLYDPVASLPMDHSTQIHYNPEGAPAWATIEVFEYKLGLAISKWKEKCAVRIKYGGLTTNPTETLDNVFVIGWKPIDSYVAAYVTGTAEPTSDPMEWDIVDSDMTLDPIDVTEFNIDSLLLHELGHMIGINHSNLNNVVMSGPPLSTYNNLDVLQQDDHRACKFLYGYTRG